VHYVLPLCGILFSLDLVCLGLCLEELSFVCWWNSGRLRSAAIWKMVPICIFWCVWKELSLRRFEDLESSMEDILVSFFRTLYLWTMGFFVPSIA
jgi:hypothetical protein